MDYPVSVSLSVIGCGSPAAVTFCPPVLSVCIAVLTVHFHAVALTVGSLYLIAVLIAAVLVAAVLVTVVLAAVRRSPAVQTRIGTRSGLPAGVGIRIPACAGIIICFTQVK